jgi:hypothetical protein
LVWDAGLEGALEAVPVAATGMVGAAWMVKAAGGGVFRAGTAPFDVPEKLLMVNCLTAVVEGELQNSPELVKEVVRTNEWTETVVIVAVAMEQLVMVVLGCEEKLATLAGMEEVALGTMELVVMVVVEWMEEMAMEAVVLGGGLARVGLEALEVVAASWEDLAMLSAGSEEMATVAVAVGPAAADWDEGLEEVVVVTGDSAATVRDPAMEVMEELVEAHGRLKDRQTGKIVIHRFAAASNNW